MVRAFVQMRDLLSAQAEVSEKFRALEARLDTHDAHIAALIDAVRWLLAPEEDSQRKIGFLVREE